MKEFEYTFTKGLLAALRAESTNPRNSQALVECVNMRATILGLKSFLPITNPFIGVVADWPFPQIFLGSVVWILGTKTKVYEINGAWGITEELTVSSSGVWDFVDFFDFIVMSNGSQVVLRSSTGTYSLHSSTSEVPEFATCCEFNGRVIVGNVLSSWNNCGAAHVVWSKIGSFDFTPDQSNVAGYMQIPKSLEVKRVMKLGEFVVVYGDSSIYALAPVSQPAVTFGLRKIADFGIAQRGAVAGYNNKHVFISESGVVYQLTEKLELRRLGYQEFFEPLLDSVIVGSYNSVEEEYYFATDEKGYVLTEMTNVTQYGTTYKSYGLTEIYQSITTVACAGGVSYGVSKDTDDLEFRLTTDTLDFGQRSLKTIQTVEVSTNSTDDVYVRIAWKVDKKSDWSYTGWVITNPLGISTIPCSGTEFRIQVKSASFSTIDIDSIKLRVKFTDKRSIRGVYSASQAIAGSGS